VHLADGILADPVLLVGLNAVGAAGVAVALRKASVSDGREAAWVGTLGAFVLAVQALNVPLGPGVSAHAIGAGLLSVTLGPARAVLALTGVLIVQALLLADGGVSALGINALNLAIVPVVCVHAARRLLGPTPAAVAIGTALGSVAGASSLALTLVIGSGAPPALTFGLLVGIQALAGVAEGVLTALSLRALERRAPALVRGRAPGVATEPITRRGLALAALAIGFALALIPLASSRPDALEAVLERLRPAP
jgi:cobalt/nickel transport system permease protein